MSLLSSKLTTRLWITAVTISIAFGASFLLLYRVGAVEIRPLGHRIAVLSMDIGSFTGVDHEMDPQVAKSVGATESISRKYTNPTGAEIALHIAHLPRSVNQRSHTRQSLLPASGWRIVGEQSVPIETMDRPARVLTVEREGSQSLVLYWYCGMAMSVRPVLRRLDPPETCRPQPMAARREGAVGDAVRRISRRVT